MAEPRRIADEIRDAFTRTRKILSPDDQRAIAEGVARGHGCMVVGHEWDADSIHFRLAEVG